MVNFDNKEVKFRVEMEISTFLPPEMDTEATRDWFLSFIQTLTIGLPEDTPKELYFLTRVIKAQCIKYGKAEL